MNKFGVIWITGLSGAGKTTVATGLRDLLADHGQQAVLLDGDELRAILGRQSSFSAHERRELAMVYARLAKHLADQGFLVICATISMFHDVRTWNRENNKKYFEVYLRVPDPERLRRDPKGLYREAGSENRAGMVGHKQDFEEPQAPDIVIENHAGVSASDATASIWTQITNQSFI